MQTQKQILIIDFGSQYTLVISRTLRELGVRSIILAPQKVKKFLEHNDPKAIILSGSNYSVTDDDAPQFPVEILDKKVPILGICYGLHLITNYFGGELANHVHDKEYGPAEIFFKGEDALLKDLISPQKVWASHGDSIEKLPEGFTIIATSISGTIEAIMHPSKRIWGIQFHPEVTQTLRGKQLLSNFVFDIADCEIDWKPSDIIQQIRDEVVTEVGNKKIIMGLSGGVDSSTLVGILAPVLKNNLLAVCIDTGSFREGELEEVQRNTDAMGVNFKIVDAKELFQQEIGDCIDAEEKRKRFKKAYTTVFETEIKSFEADFIAQGTLATDIIESGAVGEAQLIKSHHNVGLIWSVPEIRPLRHLFKYEVRELAKEVGLPESVAQRQPFPGPGLFVRIVGLAPNSENLAIVRWADHKVTEILKKYGIYSDISQLIVALIGANTVGIKGDGRVYKPSIVVRAVQTVDFMTLKGMYLPEYIAMEIIETVTKHPEIVRVWFDATPKPPATTEME